MFIRHRVPKAETVDDLQKIVASTFGVERDPLKVRTPAGQLNVYRPRTYEGWHGPAGQTAITSIELHRLPPWWPAEPAFKIVKVKNHLQSAIWLTEAAPDNPLHAGSFVIMQTRRKAVLLWVMSDGKFSAEWPPLEIYERMNADYAGFIDEAIEEKVIRTVPHRTSTGNRPWSKVPLNRLECEMRWRPVKPPQMNPASPVSRETERYLESKGLKLLKIER